MRAGPAAVLFVLLGNIQTVYAADTPSPPAAAAPVRTSAPDSHGPGSPPQQAKGTAAKEDSAAKAPVNRPNVPETPATGPGIDQAADQAKEAASAAISQAGAKPAPATPNLSPDQKAMLDTIKSLLDSLVQSGTLAQDKADAVLKSAQERFSAAQPKRPPPPANPNVVGVPYVPQFVKDDIAKELRKEMDHEVVNDVVAKARNQGWGIPGALPDWLKRITISGDIRVRGQADMFDSGNVPYFYPDVLRINQAGGLAKATYPYENTNVNQYRLRLRGRVGMDVAITSNFKAGLRLSTGNTANPVTFNQDLGTYNTPFQVVWNDFYLRYQNTRTDGSPLLTVWAGRFPNPWLYTDLVWYGELNFNGVAATQRLYLSGAGRSGTNGATGHNYLFLTVGAFPLQDIQFTTNDKWLYGAQFGTDLTVQRGSVLKVGVAYYDYANISGKRNATGLSLLDYTAPPYVQKGNTIFDISDPGDTASNVYALAPEYRLVDVTAKLDFSQLAPIHITLVGDYVKNVGYNSHRVAQIFQSENVAVPATRNVGYQVGLVVGWPQEDIAWPGRWQIYGAYKYLQRDAVLDAFTDSNFHLGGTDAQGYVLRGEVGIRRNVWLAAHWYSSNSIDGPHYGIDTLQLDVLAKF